LTVSFAANPVTDAVAVEPACPEDGDSERVLVTLNVAVATSLLDAPVAVIV
jgi:hypothetical protein